MLYKSILVLLCCCVYNAVSLSPFFKKGQRAEIYELMDDVMPTLKIYMPEKHFAILKDKARKVFPDSATPIIETESTSSLIEDSDSDIFSNLPYIMYDIKYKLKFYKRINFTEIYPGYNFNENLPQLQIGEDGYAQYDVEEVFNEYDYDPEHYKELNIDDYDLLQTIIFKSNKNFNLLEINNKFEDMTLKMSIDVMELYDKVGEITFDSWETDEFYKYNKNLTTEEIVEDKTEVDDGDDIFGFKTKNATMIFELNGNKKSFNKVTFSVSGHVSRYLPKPMYNLKIKDGKELYGRRHFKLRTDMRDPTFLRSKLTSDIRNRLGITSISTNYILLYINDEYMGLYIMTDVINLPWIENVFDDKKSTTLFKCMHLTDFLPRFSYGCENKNEDVTDDTEWINFLTTIENAKSASDLEAIFDIEHFLYEMAIDYLVNAMDHMGHNFYLYKQPNGKWTYISFDFDQDFSLVLNDYSMKAEDYFNSYNFKGHLYDVLITQDSSRFNETIKDVLNKAINPSTLYPHIDEIKEFIRPYVELEKTPDSNGIYPGELIHPPSHEYFSIQQWDAYTDFNNGKIDAEWSKKFGLKYLILMKYRYICTTYQIECDPIYMDENYDYSGKTKEN